MAPAAAVGSSKKAVYAPWDGRLVGETPEHYRVIAHVHDALRTWFRPRGDVYVGVNLFVYKAGRSAVSVDDRTPYKVREWFHRVPDGTSLAPATKKRDHAR